MSSDDPLLKRQFNVQLPADLIDEIKHASILEGTTLSAFVEELLRASMNNREAVSNAA